MNRKLPMFGDLARRRPTVDAARQKLGGRLTKAAGQAPGRLVEVDGLTGEREVGVVLFAEAGLADVLFDRGVVRRLASTELSAASEIQPPNIERLAVAVRRFGELAEGDPIVIAQHDGTNARGVLREKCRFGALVEKSDGAIVAVGFDRVAPLPIVEFRG